MAQLTGTETVLDAYCGTGTIGLVAAKGLPETPEATRLKLSVWTISNLPLRMLIIMRATMASKMPLSKQPTLATS